MKRRALRSDAVEQPALCKGPASAYAGKPVSAQNDTTACRAFCPYETYLCKIQTAEGCGGCGVLSSCNCEEPDRPGMSHASGMRQ